jgi:hypothetical protein
MQFTFYGDLLGISGSYKLNTNVANKKLKDFYETVFNTLSDYCRQRSDTKVFMFSDSLLFYGDDGLSALEQLQIVYIKLLYKGLLIRGAMAAGKLQFEPRLTLENFTKFLPDDDTLARAVGLESTKKGARLLIEKSLASRLLKHYPEWLTQEGYIRNVNKQQYLMVSYGDILR